MLKAYGCEEENRLYPRKELAVCSFGKMFWCYFGTKIHAIGCVI